MAHIVMERGVVHGLGSYIVMAYIALAEIVMAYIAMASIDMGYLVIATGARYMVSDGCLDGVDAIYGVHLMNTLHTGTIGVKSGRHVGMYTCRHVDM